MTWYRQIESLAIEFLGVGAFFLFSHSSVSFMFFFPLSTNFFFCVERKEKKPLKKFALHLLPPSFVISTAFVKPPPLKKNGREKGRNGRGRGAGGGGGDALSFFLGSIKRNIQMPLFFLLLHFPIFRMRKKNQSYSIGWSLATKFRGGKKKAAHQKNFGGGAEFLVAPPVSLHSILFA